MKRKNKSRKNMRKNASKRVAQSSVTPPLKPSVSSQPLDAESLDIKSLDAKPLDAEKTQTTQKAEPSVKDTTSVHAHEDVPADTTRSTPASMTTVARPWPVLPDDADYLKQDPILKTVSRAVFALVMLFALLLLWRGHNAPGGGFIAGLMTLCAFMLHRMANGHNVIRLDATMMVAIGMSLSFLTGLVPYLFGKSFLKSDYGYITTALTGEFEWATALLFDLGVYLVVVGAGSSITGSLHRIHPEELVEDDLTDERA